MNKLISTLLASLGFGIWPMFAKKSIAGPNWTIMVISMVTFVGVLGVFLFQRSYREPITKNDIIFLVIAGVINVGAWVFYSLIFDDTNNAHFASYVMILGVAIPIFAALAAYFILKEPISLQKIIGLFLGVISIYLLNK